MTVGFPVEEYVEHCAALADGFAALPVDMEIALVTSLPADPPCYLKWHAPPRIGRIRALTKMHRWLRRLPFVRLYPLDLLRYEPGARSRDVLRRLKAAEADPFLRAVFPGLVDVMNDEAWSWEAWDPAEVRRLFEEADRYDQAIREAFVWLNPDLVVVLQDLDFYEGQLLWEVCRSRGVPCFGLGSTYFSPYYQAETHVNETVDLVAEAWNKRTDREALSPETGRRVLERYKEIQHLQMHHTRSLEGAPFLERQAGVKTVVLLLSSAPERYSPAFESVFRTQAEMAGSVAALFRGRSNARLIVRTHPVDVPDSRRRIRRALEAAGAGAHVCLVDDPSFNTYDLLPVIDLGLVGYSEMGLELMAEGIPVIYGAKVAGALCPFALWPRSASEYLDLLERYLDGEDIPRPDPQEVLRYVVHYNEVVNGGVVAWPYYPPPAMRDAAAMARRLIEGIVPRGEDPYAERRRQEELTRRSWRLRCAREVVCLRPWRKEDRPELRAAARAVYFKMYHSLRRLLSPRTER